ncbi:MAG: hypothetical protein IPP87_20100 [Ideonella sp.]|nr:hypothetical protein [Ideonella sp.]
MTPLADAVLHQLASLLGAARPRARALHLPPLPWNGTKDGEFGALELDDGSLGLGYVLLGDTLAALAGDAAASRASTGTDALALAQRWRSGDPASRALGLAAVNALSRHLMDRAGFVPPPATDSIAGLAPQAGEHIGMVGYFPPLLKQVTSCGARLTVLELRTDLVGERDGYTVTTHPEALHDCDKVLCTSTVLMNHSLDDVLAQCHRATAIALIGPSAGCLPDALFARGVTAIGGTWIMDPAALIAALKSGTPWSAHARKFVLTRAAWGAGFGRPMPI